MFSQDGGATSHHSKQDCHDNSWGFSSITRCQHTNKNSDIQMSQTKWTGGKKGDCSTENESVETIGNVTDAAEIKNRKICVVAGGAETKH